jgi:hypothetical protein
MARSLFRKAVQPGRSKRRGESYSLPYVEPLSAARTPLADFVNRLLVFLHSLSPSRMATEAIGKTPGPMNALRFRPKVPDQIIIQRPGTEALVPLLPVTVPTGLCTGCSKDQITVGIDGLINLSGYCSLHNPFAATDPRRHDEERYCESKPSFQHATPLLSPGRVPSSQAIFSMARNAASRSSGVIR